MLAGQETVAKTVSKPGALSRGKISDDPGSVAELWVMGAREESRDPAQATGRDC